jgi:hypothetical protein
VARLILGPVRRKMLERGLPAVLDGMDRPGTRPSEASPSP